MNNKEICSFFVSDYHLLTALLPYINEKIFDEKKIQLILENDMNKKVKEYFDKVKVLNLQKEEILNLEWKKSKLEKISSNDEQIIITIGSKEYIEKVKNVINLNNECEEIIDCYLIKDMEEIDNILPNYNKILNTEGVKNLKENSQNAQKRKTIKTQI